MTKHEMEKAIIDKIKVIVEYNNELDESKIELYNDEVANGYIGDKPFLFNGYIYTTELTDIISTVMFGHRSQERVSYDKKFRGVPRGNNYKNILTDEETKKINQVMYGMVNANIIKFSKSKAMLKLL